MKSLATNGRILGNFDAFLNRQDELQHSYEKFRFAGDINKPSFDEVYNIVREYVKEILPV